MSLILGITVALALFVALSGVIVAVVYLRQRRTARLNHQGVQYQDWRMWEPAIKCYQAALQLDSSHAATHYNLGYALYHGRRVTEPARVHLEKAVELEPGMAAAHYALGHLLFHHRRSVPEAQSHLKRALELKPELAEAYNTLGLMEIEAQNWHGAMECFGNAVDADAACDQAYSNLAIACIYQGRNAEAIAHAQKYAELRPRSAVAHKNLGNIYGACGKREPAIEELQACVTLDAGDWIVHFWLGCLYLQTDQPGKAVRSFHESLRIRGPFGLSHYNLALCYEALGKRDLARRHIDRAVELNPSLGKDLI